MIEKGKSVWMDSVTMPSFPPLKQNIETDVVVIGGGLCGILCAYYIKKRGFSVVVVEKDHIGMGITKNTTAVITAQHDTLYKDRIKKDGFEKARQYLHANLVAVEEYRKLSETYDFDFEDKPSYMYTTNQRKELEEELEALHHLGFDAKWKEEIDLPIVITGAIEYPNQAQMNALLLIQCLAKELDIYEETEIKNMDGEYAYTNHHKIKAKKIIFTTHFPFMDRMGMYYVKMYQNRSYVIAIPSTVDLKGTYVDMENGGLYFRKYKDYMLIGGNDRKTGDKGRCFDNLVSFVNEHYKGTIVAYEWANQDCVTLDDMPYIGNYSSFSKNVYVATGFNLWGMTSAMVAAHLLADLMEGKPNPYEKLFNPNRNILKKQLFVNLGRYMKHLLMIKPKRCSHMGSILKWNDEEKTWDCPCHGSRFSKDGELLDNPATKNI